MPFFEIVGKTQFVLVLLCFFQVRSISSEPEILILLSYNHTNYIDILKEIRSNLEYKRKKIDENSNLKSELDKIQDIPDIFYVIPDPIYGNENFEYLSNYIIQKKVILMTTYSGLTDLDSGIRSANGVYYPTMHPLERRNIWFSVG